MSGINEQLAGIYEQLDALEGRVRGSSANSLSNVRIGEVVSGGPRRYTIRELADSGQSLGVHQGVPSARGVPLAPGDTVLLLFFDGVQLPIAFQGGGSSGSAFEGGIVGYLRIFGI